MSSSKQQTFFKLLPVKSLVFVFCVLSFLVVTNILLSSSSNFAFIVDISMRVKSDFTKTLKKILEVDRLEALNGTMNGTLTLKPVTSQGAASDGEIRLVIDNGVEIKRMIVDNSTESTETEENAGIRYDVLGNPLISENKERQRQDICENCFKHKFNYVIDNESICKLNSDQTEIQLLIIILTVHKNLLQRNALRETWLTYSKNNTADIRYAFLLGEVSDSRQREDVLKESERFGDIIKEDFVDSYTNLTYKTIMGFKWASTKCNVAKFVMKTDDDMYVNIPNLLSIVKNNASLLQTHIGGSCAQVAGPIRNRKSKWFASVKSYPRKYYPGFCSGTGYVTSMNVAQKVYEVSPHVPFFHLEDVYVALCIKRLGYHLKGLPGFNPGHPNLDPCLYNGNTLVTAHYMTPEMTKRMWQSKCRSWKTSHVKKRKKRAYD